MRPSDGLSSDFKWLLTNLPSRTNRHGQNAKRISKRIEAEKERDDIREPWYCWWNQSCTAWDEKNHANPWDNSTYTNWWAGFLNDQTVAWGLDFCLDGGGSASSWYWRDSVSIIVYPNDIDSSMLNLCFFSWMWNINWGIFLLRNHCGTSQASLWYVIAKKLFSSSRIEWLERMQAPQFKNKPITVERTQRNPHRSKFPSFPRATSPFAPMPTQPSRKVQNKFFRGVDWKTHCHVLLQVQYLLCVRFQANILSYSGWALHQIQ